MKTDTGANIQINDKLGEMLRVVTIYQGDQGATFCHETVKMSNKEQHNKAGTGRTCFSSCVICLCFLGQEEHMFFVKNSGCWSLQLLLV